MITNVSQKTRELVESFATALLASVRAEILEDVQRVFGSNEAVKKAKPVKVRTRRAGKHKVGRLVKDIPKIEMRVLSYVKAHPRCRRADVAWAAKITTHAATAALVRLRGKRAVKSVGERRGTRWLAA